MYKEELIQKILSYPILDFLKSSDFYNLISLKEEEKIDCYFDCDGVLVDTISVSFKEMNEILKEKGIILKPNRQKQTIEEGEFISNYYRNINWYQLIERSGQIDQSFAKVKAIKESQVFKNVGIATHRHSLLNEGEAKKQLIQEQTKATVFTIPIKISKSTALKAQGNILIDDSKAKIEDWINHGGIGVLFVQRQENEPDYFILNPSPRPYYITNNILNVLKIPSLTKLLQTPPKTFTKKY